MKILMVSSMEIAELPPAISLIKAISEDGHFLHLVCEFGDAGVSDELGSVELTKLDAGSTLRAENDRGLLGRIKRFVYWNLIFKLVKPGCLRAEVKRQWSSGNYDILWVLHESTAKRLGKLAVEIPHVLSAYELDRDFICEGPTRLKEVAKTALKVIVPEAVRSKIMRTYCGLNSDPAVLPNKPNYGDIEARLPVEVESRLCELKSGNRKVIIYSGIFIPERKLDAVIEAVARRSDEYSLVFMGKGSAYLDSLTAKYPGGFDYLGFVEPPAHLLALRFADVGVLSYVPTEPSLNALFCAPNKIWEYAYYGLPMLANDVPGLTMTVEKNLIGVCASMDSVEEVVSALDLISEKYDLFAQNSKKFYYSVDYREEYKKVMKQICGVVFHGE